MNRTKYTTGATVIQPIQTFLPDYTFKKVALKFIIDTDRNILSLESYAKTIRSFEIIITITSKTNFSDKAEAMI